MVYPKAYNSAITAEWIAKNTFEIISRVKICAISSAKATSPLEKLARIGSRNTQVKMNPKTPQTKSYYKDTPKNFQGSLWISMADVLSNQKQPHHLQCFLPEP
mgnify:CR=1 FL=1